MYCILLTYFYNHMLREKRPLLCARACVCLCVRNKKGVPVVHNLEGRFTSKVNSALQRFTSNTVLLHVHRNANMAANKQAL